MAVALALSMSDQRGGVMADGHLTYEGVAERTGYTVESLRTLHWRAQKRRAAGIARPNDLPAPDKMYGRTPTWLPETIDTWISIAEGPRT